jgi:cell division septum initiation protein DivIVA/DNA-binding XRE family transcriptional regulator
VTSQVESGWSSDDLRQARRAAELTQAELADRLDVRLWMVDQWESGTRPIPQDRVEEIVEATGWTSADESSPAPRSEAVVTRQETREALETEGGDETQLRPAPVAPTMEPVHDDTSALDPDLPKALRGYEPAAVHALLGELAAARDQLVRELTDAKARAAELEVQVQTAEEHAPEVPGDVPDLREQEDLIRDAIMTAQRAANEVREEARRSASEVLRDAESRAEQIVGEAEKECERLAGEISRLEELAETSRVAVSAFLSSLLDQVNPGASVEPEGIEADLDEVIFEQIGKVAEPADADRGARASKRPTSS